MSTDVQKDQIQNLEKVVAEALAQVSSVMASHQRAIADLSARTAGLEQCAALGGEMWRQWSAEPYCALDGRLRMVRADGTVAMGYRRDQDAPHDPDHAYVSFEDAFRGPSTRVRDLVAPYLDLLQDRRTIIELGCGRGELLDLLPKDGRTIIGVDQDTGMLQRTRATDVTEHEGVSLVQDDISVFLAGRADESADAIVSVEVFEHIDPVTIPDLLANARRVLQPGGILVMETVNPHNLTAYKLFWLDMTHRHPLFPEAMVVLCAAAGFDGAAVHFSASSGRLESDLVLSDRYTLVARRD